MEVLRELIQTAYKPICAIYGFSFDLEFPKMCAPCGYSLLYIVCRIVVGTWKCSCCLLAIFALFTIVYVCVRVRVVE